MLDKFARAAGFSSTEMKALLFLLVLFITGLMYKYFTRESLPPLQKFDYSLSDSIFNAAGTGMADAIDYKVEVLDLKKHKIAPKKKTDLLKPQQINLNKAQLNDLVMLPGIGEATAKNILTYRESRGGFKALNELMNVKRIGEKTFNQIKIYLYIDNKTDSSGGKE